MLPYSLFSFSFLFLIFAAVFTSAQTQRDLTTIRERRIKAITGGLSSGSVAGWMQSLDSNGKWPDVDYTTGCDARRASWPAQSHWSRLVTMAAAWHGGVRGNNPYVKNAKLRTAIARGMAYWFSRDFRLPGCLDRGGTSVCPCSNTDKSLWNQNWFSNVILIPRQVIQACLLLDTSILGTEQDSCIRFASRSYAAFAKPISIGKLTGANALDIAQIGIDLALQTKNLNLLADAFRNLRSEVAVKSAAKSDGIRADGSFGQHEGILYNGGYGKDFANVILNVELLATGTSLTAGSVVRSAVETLFDANFWMTTLNTNTDVLHWDMNAVGRFISFPVADNQATGSLKINLTQVGELGRLWGSAALQNFAGKLSAVAETANAASLVGNRMFYANDYIVHRGPKYVTSLKMHSSRTKNSECINSQNTRGFHLTDGALYQYIKGDEYEDIAAAWDWNLIPGTTTDYGATTLNCGATSRTGIESFVGGASDGKVGVAAMRYTNPISKTFKFQKAWFFLQENIQHVMVSNIRRTGSASVYSVLDQRMRRGRVMVDDVWIGYPSSMSSIRPRTLWHGDVGYIFPTWGSHVALNVQTGKKTGTWSTIGTSSRPATTVDFYSAWLKHSNISVPVSYTIVPGLSYKQFEAIRATTLLQSVANTNSVSAVYQEKHRIAMVVFWSTTGGSVTFSPGAGQASITLSANRNIAMIYRIGTRETTVSDPSQKLTSVDVTFRQGSTNRKLTIALPTGGRAGRSVTKTL